MTHRERDARAGARAWACCVLVLSGCQLIGGFETFHEKTGSAGDNSGTGGARAGGCEGPAPGKHPPDMAPVRRQDGTCFWIDQTEVSVSDYAEFLMNPPSVQVEDCAWNVPVPDGGARGSGGTPGFEPDRVCKTNAGGLAPDGKGSDLPMVCVDWCDALAYCAWAGKDLCRDNANYPEDVEQSEWYSACAGTGAPPKIYGCGSCQSAVPYCNGRSSGPVPVKGMPDCAAPSDDESKPVYDLTGNVAEWTGWCNTQDECAFRGGSYASTDSALECAHVSSQPRSRTLETLGFRCCAKPIVTDGG